MLPYHPVRNYLTKYSGITAKLLEGVTTRLEDVQATLVTIVCKDDVLVGHSMENDLLALGIVHERIVDTAHLFRNGCGGGGRKHSLKHLAACLLQRKIQVVEGVGGRVGHCSEEDAEAALILAVRRARRGSSFRLHEKREGRKNIMELIATIRRNGKHIMDDGGGEGGGGHNKLLSGGSGGGLGGPLVCIGPDGWIREHVGNNSTANALICDNIFSSSVKALNSYLRPGKRKASMLWAKLVVDGTDVDRSNEKIDEILVRTYT